jgi:hypothetical protein
MKWKDHRRIARAIAQKLDLPEEMLVKGSIEPDISRGAYERHHGAFSSVMDELKIARRFQLEGSRWEAAGHLGRAVHYIHDSCTGKGLLGLSHNTFTPAPLQRAPDDVFA